MTFSVDLFDRDRFETPGFEFFTARATPRRSCSQGTLRTLSTGFPSSRYDTFLPPATQLELGTHQQKLAITSEESLSIPAAVQAAQKPPAALPL